MEGLGGGGVRYEHLCKSLGWEVVGGLTLEVPIDLFFQNMSSSLLMLFAGEDVEYKDIDVPRVISVCFWVTPASLRICHRKRDTQRRDIIPDYSFQLNKSPCLTLFFDP